VFQSRAGFSECLDVLLPPIRQQPPSFNPVLGFLSVSTIPRFWYVYGLSLFQSRAGFSECLDHGRIEGHSSLYEQFQSRAGFSECLDTGGTGRCVG